MIIYTSCAVSILSNEIQIQNIHHMLQIHAYIKENICMLLLSAVIVPPVGSTHAKQNQVNENV